jgi:hypothetical protein
LFESGKASEWRIETLAIAMGFFPHLYQLAQEAVIALPWCTAFVQLGFSRIPDANSASVPSAFHFITTLCNYLCVALPTLPCRFNNSCIQPIMLGTRIE